MGNKKSVGGQAVIEGVMMRGSKGVATAVRTPSGQIVVDKKNMVPFVKKYKFLDVPIIRGFVSFVESLVVGIKTLNYSASFYEEDEEEESKVDKYLEKVFKDKKDDVLMGGTLIISLIISFGLFFMLPTVAANFFKRIKVTNTLLLNIIEGIIRVTIFLIYIYVIGKMEDMKRVFQYHGAEHKSIFCYENNCELTPENAAKYGRLHPRCGTNFLFLVMIISIILFSITGWKSIGQRILYRVILLPLISGITYEVIKWMGKSDSTLSKILSYPGMMLQKLTTKEPDISQLEVAIAALKACEGL